MRRPSLVLLVVIGGFVLLGILSTPASAGTKTASSLTARTKGSTIDGAPARIDVRLADTTGRPIGGAVVRLVTTTTFLGAPHTEVLDEAETTSAGRAVLTFSPSDVGSVDVEVRYDGDAYHAGSSAALTFDVHRPTHVYQQAPVGIQAPWAHAYLIPLPFLGIWITYAVVVLQVRKIRRAGLPRVR